MHRVQKTHYNHQSEVRVICDASKVDNRCEKNGHMGNWTCENALLRVIDVGYRKIVGQDLFNKLGLAIVKQQPRKGKSVNHTYLNSTKQKQNQTSNCVAIFRISFCNRIIRVTYF